jgi:hypothetical protein
LVVVHNPHPPKKGDDILAKLKKETRIKKFIEKLKLFFKDLSEDEETLAMALIEEIAFMKITMEDLKEEVNLNGVITEMTQGEYSISRENPALKSYNTTVQRYNASIKQLDEFLNKNTDINNDEEDRLKSFLVKK